MHWQAILKAAWRQAFAQIIRTPQDGCDARAVAVSGASPRPLLEWLGGHPAYLPFMARERLAMAHIPIACKMHRRWGLPATPEAGRPTALRTRAR